LVAGSNPARPTNIETSTVSTPPQQDDTQNDEKLEGKLPISKSRKKLKDRSRKQGKYFQPLGYSQPPFKLSLNKPKLKPEDT
jgi:hypothetical protein